MARSTPKFSLPKDKCKMVVNPKSMFDSKSFRWIPTASGAILIGCPKGEWGGKKCKVGTRAHEIIRAIHDGKCRRGYKRAK
jgi:hypothetical protein